MSIESPVSWPPSKGDLLCNGRFRIDVQLGEGVDAIAFSATDLLCDETVVCKVPRSTTNLTSSNWSVWIGQYRKLRSVLSLDVVRPLGLYEHRHLAQSIPVLVIELVDGPTIRDQPANSLYQRLTLLERTATALGALHDAGLTHGDFHIGNILVSGNRVVIIDPAAHRWGATSSDYSSSSRSGRSEQLRGVHPGADDLVALGQVIHDVMNTESFYTDWLTDQLTTDGSRPNGHETAEFLRSIRLKIPTASPKSLETLAEWSTKEIDTRHDLYRMLRHKRHELLTGLLAVIHNAARLTKITVAATGFGTELQGELASDKGKSGLFQARSITATNRDGDEWTIMFPSVSEFRKPFPPSGFPNVKIEGLLSTGISQITRHGSVAWSEEVYIFWLSDKQRAGFCMGGLGRAVEIDRWIMRNFQILSGARICGLKGIEDFNSQNSRYTRVENLSINLPSGIIKGIDCLKLILDSAISSNTPEHLRYPNIRTAQLTHLFHKNDEEAKIRLITDVLVPQILAGAKDYARAFCVDFLIQEGTNEVFIEIELFPHGADKVEWIFKYQAPSNQPLL